MANLSGEVGELRMTLQIKRAETGKVETVELIGRVTQDQAEELGLKDQEHVSHP